MSSRIGELLVKSGLINERQLEEALARQREKYRKLGDILIELGYITSHELVWMLSEQASLPFIEIKPEMLDSGLIHSFPERLLYNLCVLPLYETDDNVYMAIGDPTQVDAVEQLRPITGKSISLSGAEPEKILQLLDKFFLIEQTELLFLADDDKGKITIEIADQVAIVRRVDDHGTTIVKRVPVEVVIKLGKRRRGG